MTRKKCFIFNTASVISFFLLSQIQKKNSEGHKEVKKKEKKKKEMEKQWGLKWLKVLFVLWLSGQHPDSSVSVVSDSDHWLLHSKELDQINVLSKKKKKKLLCCFCSNGENGLFLKGQYTQIINKNINTFVFAPIFSRGLKLLLRTKQKFMQMFFKIHVS